MHKILQQMTGEKQFLEKRVLFSQSRREQGAEAQPGIENKNTILDVKNADQLLALQRKARKTVEEATSDGFGAHAIGRIMSGHLLSASVPDHMVAEIRNEALKIRGVANGKWKRLKEATIAGLTPVTTDYTKERVIADQQVLDVLQSQRSELITLLGVHGKEAKLDETTGKTTFSRKTVVDTQGNHSEALTLEEQWGQVGKAPVWALHEKASRGLMKLDQKVAEHIGAETSKRLSSVGNLERQIHKVDAAIAKVKEGLQKKESKFENRATEFKKIEDLLAKMNLTQAQIQQLTSHVTKNNQLPDWFRKVLQEYGMESSFDSIEARFKQALFGTVGLRTFTKKVGLNRSAVITAKQDIKAEKAKTQTSAEFMRTNQIAGAELVKGLRERNIETKGTISFNISAEYKERMPHLATLKGKSINIPANTPFARLMKLNIPSLGDVTLDFTNNTLEYTDSGNGGVTTVPLAYLSPTYTAGTEAIDNSREEVDGRETARTFKDENSLEQTPLQSDDSVTFYFDSEKQSQYRSFGFQLDLLGSITLTVIEQENNKITFVKPSGMSDAVDLKLDLNNGRFTLGENKKLSLAVLDRSKKPEIFRAKTTQTKDVTGSEPAT